MPFISVCEKAKLVIKKTMINNKFLMFCDVLFGLITGQLVSVIFRCLNVGIFEFRNSLYYLMIMK